MKKDVMSLFLIKLKLGKNPAREDVSGYVRQYLGIKIEE